MSNVADWGKRVLIANEAVLYGIFGVISGTGFFPPRAFLNEFFMGASDPCDQDLRMGTWVGFELSPEEYEEVLSWWKARHPGAVDDSFGVERWDD